MLIVVPSLIILAIGTLIVLVIKAAFPTTVRNEHTLIKKTILFRKEPDTNASMRDRNRGPVRRGYEKDLKASDYIVVDNSQNI